MELRKKKVLTVLYLGLAVLGWRVYVGIAKYSPTDPVEAEPSVVAVDFDQADGVVGEDENIVRMLDRQGAIVDMPWGRDPFADISGMFMRRELVLEELEINESVPPPEPPTLNLGGISVSDGQWLAVVNGDVIRVGDTVRETFKVIEIRKRSVTIASGNWAIRYELGGEAPIVFSLSEVPE